jgi:integrase
MRVDNQKPKDKQYSVRDKVVRGLELVVYPSGRKAWRLRRTIPQTHRRVQIIIGDAELMTLTDARRKVEELAARIASGEDPSAPQVGVGELSLRSLFQHYMAEHSSVMKRSSKDDQSIYNVWLKPYAKLNIKTMTRRDAAGIHKTMGLKSKVRANRALSLLSAMCSWASDNDLIPENPCLGIRRFPEKSRERFLTADELRDFLAHVESHPIEWFRDLIKLAVFTGQRLGNLLSMRWDEVTLPDEGPGQWVIPEDKFKNGDRMHASLPRQAVEVLLARKNGSEWVFPGEGASGHRTPPWQVWSDFLAEHDIKDLRIHDLRRSFGSLLAAKGVPLQVIGKALGHRSLQSTKIYARLQDQAVQDAVSSAMNEI